jgi:hypothetical protein
MKQRGEEQRRPRLEHGVHPGFLGVKDGELARREKDGRRQANAAPTDCPTSRVSAGNRQSTKKDRRIAERELGLPNEIHPEV